MLFGLKNDVSAYQRMLIRMFEAQLGKNVEAYVEDMVVKRKEVSEHLGDLNEVFSVLRKYKLCLNASKCSFEVGSGKFLGCMITHGGIEVNLDSIKAIHSLLPPWNLKEVQRLMGMTATLIDLYLSQLTNVSHSSNCFLYGRILHGLTSAIRLLRN